MVSVHTKTQSIRLNVKVHPFIIYDLGTTVKETSQKAGMNGINWLPMSDNWVQEDGDVARYFTNFF